MALRQTRLTKCPGCGVDVEIKNARPDATRRAYCSTCKESPYYKGHRQAHFKYGINLAEYSALMTQSNCNCCGKDLIGGKGRGHGAHNKRQIDHCHITGKIRGVLCWDCNVGIGKLGDNVEGLLKALDYLRR